MKAPDKIYIGPMLNPSDGYVGIAWAEAHGGMEEYVRKDALLEWANVHKTVIETNGEEDDAYTRGQYSAILTLIDKLNSM